MRYEFFFFIYIHKTKPHLANFQITIFLQALSQFCGEVIEVHNDSSTYENRLLYEVSTYLFGVNCLGIEEYVNYLSADNKILVILYNKR